MEFVNSLDGLALPNLKAGEVMVPTDVSWNELKQRLLARPFIRSCDPRYEAWDISQGAQREGGKELLLACTWEPIPYDSPDRGLWKRFRSEFVRERFRGFGARGNLRAFIEWCSQMGKSLPSGAYVTLLDEEEAPVVEEFGGAGTPYFWVFSTDKGKNGDEPSADMWLQPLSGEDGWGDEVTFVMFRSPPPSP